jgi:hypothetical protein
MFLFSGSSPEKAVARHQAFIVSGHAGAADDRSHGIDRAGHEFSERTFERRATIVLAAHAAQVGGNIFRRYAIEFLLRFQRETRPVGRIGAACTAALAVEIL